MRCVLPIRVAAQSLFGSNIPFQHLGAHPIQDARTIKREHGVGHCPKPEIVEKNARRGTRIPCREDRGVRGSGRTAPFHAANGPLWSVSRGWAESCRKVFIGTSRGQIPKPGPAQRLINWPLCKGDGMSIHSPLSRARSHLVQGSGLIP